MASKAIGFLNFKFGADLSGFEKAMNKAQKGLTKFGKKIQKTGKSLSTGLTLPIIALGAASLKTFADFEQSMLKVKAVSGATGQEFVMLTDLAKKLGSTTMFTASQVADLQIELSKLGFSATQIEDSSQSILNLAQATDTELGEAAKTTAVALNSFNLEAKESTRITDIMALAASSSAMDMEKFGSVLPKVGATARIAGDSFEEMTAKIQVLADSGMEGSRMGTQLKIIYSELASKGLTWDEAMIKLQKSSNKLVTAQKLFGKNAANAGIILSENTVKLDKYSEANMKAEGTSKKLADIMDSGIGGAMRRMKSQLEGVAIEFGEQLVPIFNKVIKKVEKIVEWFSNLSDEQKKSIVKWALIVAAVGPALIIFGKIAVGFSSLITVIGGVGKAFTALYATMLKNPFIAVAALVTGFALKLTYFSKNAITARKRQEELHDALMRFQELQSGTTDLRKSGELFDKMTTKQKEAFIENLKAQKEKIENLKLETHIWAKNDNAIQKQRKTIQGLKKDLDRIRKSDNKVIRLTEGDVLNQIKNVEKTIHNITKAHVGGKGISGLNAEIWNINKSIKKYTELMPDAGDATSEFSGITEFATGEIEGSSKSISDLSLKVIEFKGELGGISEMLDPKKVDWIETMVSPFAGALGMMGDEIAMFLGMDVVAFEEGLGAMAEQLGDNLAQGAESIGEFVTDIKGMMRDIIGALISKGVAAAVSNALMNPAIAINPFLIPIIAGAAAGLARTAFNSLIPAFAEGGLVTGPTTALIGEGIGTNASNPEVVAPLDKLKQYMGGGSQNVVVTGKIVGNDIWLSNEKTQFNRQRTT